VPVHRRAQGPLLSPSCSGRHRRDWAATAVLRSPPLCSCEAAATAVLEPGRPPPPPPSCLGKAGLCASAAIVVVLGQGRPATVAVLGQGRPAASMLEPGRPPPLTCSCEASLYAPAAAVLGQGRQAGRRRCAPATAAPARGWVAAPPVVSGEGGTENFLFLF
jgi:hypothetical protein